VAEEGATVDGYYMEALRVQNGEQVSEENIYACSEMCIPRAINDALKLAALPEEQKLTATQELWLRGRQFLTNPSLPILNAADETSVIGTAYEIANYKPSPSPQPRSLEPNWKP
jgi:hypothetical protein